MAKTTDLNQGRAGVESSSLPDADRPAAPSGDREIDEIRMGIEKTRQETMETINELERRLSPSRLMADVKEKTRQMTAGRVSAMARHTGESSRRWGTALFDRIKSNPIPIMMVGGGLAWLFASGMRTQEGPQESEEAPFIDRRKSVGTDVTGTYGMGFIDRRRPSEGAEQGAGKSQYLRSRAEEVRSRAAQAGEQVRSKAGQTSEQVRLKAQQVSSSAAEYGRRAQDSLMRGSRSAREGFMHSVERNPLAAAGVAMFAGAAIGLLVPETSYEDETLGPQRDEMLERVRSAGREKVEQVEAVVHQAKESAKEEAQRQGLMSHESADKAEQSIGEASERVKDSASRLQGREKASVEPKSSTPGSSSSPSSSWEQKGPQPWTPKKPGAED